ncbi:sugar phosphate isomerase/epimerase [candidate division KSB1 bacterium]|nr:sugar phosphate isomerase/epimerase [candidate division KSB1 bacterium]
MRLGAPVFDTFDDPVDWAKAHRDLGYGGAYCPVKFNDPPELKQAYVKAAKDANLIIGEVGAWSNPLSRDEDERKAAFQKNIEGLALADEIGANCCVNIAGSRGESWAGPHKDNLSGETFEMIVEIVRHIIDEVQPTRTFYTLEAMPFTIPETPERYLELIKAVNRQHFACHLDPTNMVNSPYTFYDNTSLIRNAFQTLAPYIKSCHAKDLIMRDVSVVQIEEVIPGTGSFDYVTFLKECSKLPGDVTLMIEHLKTATEYKQASDFIRSVGSAQGIRFI